MRFDFQKFFVKHKSGVQYTVYFWSRSSRYDTQTKSEKIDMRFSEISSFF